MELNNYALDLLVDDHKMGFLDDTLVLRWSATGGHLSSSSYSKTEKKTSSSSSQIIPVQ